MAKEKLPFSIPFDALVERKERQTGQSYTQQQIAENIGISINTLRAWRDDTIKQYDRVTLGKIADWFGVEPNMLFGSIEELDSEGNGKPSLLAAS